jgi:hypothetical protein
MKDFIKRNKDAIQSFSDGSMTGWTALGDLTDKDAAEYLFSGELPDKYHIVEDGPGSFIIKSKENDIE